MLCCLQLVACSSAVNLTSPPLSFVDTKMANISINKDVVRYMVRYELTKDSPDGLYAKLHYQDLTNRKLFHTTPIGALNDVKVLNFKSLGEDKVINNQYYEMTLILYKDSNYTKAVGMHRDLIWFEVPENVAKILKITLL
ncbi:MAG: hypothetical protein ACI9N9_002095 [Enterobacterales bacterium]